MRTLLICILFIFIIACAKPYPHYSDESVSVYKLGSSIYASYLENPYRFNKLYIDNSIMFHGKVSRIYKDGTLVFRDHVFSTYSITCSLYDTNDVINIKRSDKLYMQGKLDSVSRNKFIYLKDCRILNQE